MSHQLSSSNQNTLKDSGLLESIDKRLSELESEKNEIEKKFGISESILNSFSFSDKIPLPQTLTQPMGKPKKINYENLQKIEEIKPKEIKSKYKTPDNLKDSLKYEPNINDLADKETFEPTYTTLDELKSKPTVSRDYNVCDYVDNCFNENINELYEK